MTAQEAIAKFTTDPKRFLAENCVVIAGGKTRGAGLTIFSMSSSASMVKKAGKKGAMNPRPAWSVNISNNNGGNPGQGVALANDEFIAYYIPMKQQTDNVANIFGSPPSDGSVTFLVTSQLSGCTFGFSNVHGQFVASHLQPLKDVKQADNRKNMAGLIQPGLGGQGRLVEKGTDYQDYATVVGVFRHGEWKVYMQPINFNTEGEFKEMKGITKL